MDLILFKMNGSNIAMYVTLKPVLAAGTYYGPTRMHLLNYCCLTVFLGRQLLDPASLIAAPAAALTVPES